MSGVKESHKDQQYFSMPFRAMQELARVYKYGSKKYGPYNYLAGYHYSLSIDALFRHLLAWLDSEQDDVDESGMDHMAHVAWHALNLLEMNIVFAPLEPGEYNPYDDRQGRYAATERGYYDATGFHQAANDRTGLAGDTGTGSVGCCAEGGSEE